MPYRPFDDEILEKQDIDKLTNEKSNLESTGQWTGGVNRQLNSYKSTGQIDSEIADRRAQGLPTGQLESERRNRGR